MSSAIKNIAVIGAGVTGLTAAYRLQTSGHQVTVFEKSARPGGVVQSDTAGGYLWESGPNSMQENDPRQLALFSELGLDSDKTYASPAARNRFVVRDSRPVPIPMSPLGLLATPLFSAGAKFRLLGELFCRRQARTQDLSLADFVRAHFGQEILDYAINPLVAGVYAGDPEKLSTRCYTFPPLWELEARHGSIIRGQLALAKARKASGGMRSHLLSFRRGLQMLPDALAAKLGAALLTEATIETLRPGSPWQITWSRGGTTTTSAFDAVVLALPAGGLSRLPFGGAGECPLSSLAEVEHPPVTSLFLGFHRQQVVHPLNGFGALVPAVEKKHILGVLFSSTLFPERAPADHVALTVFIGGSRQPGLTRRDPADLMPLVLDDLRSLFRISGSPVFQRQVTWPHAIPQYNLGYEHHLEAIAQAERDYPGLWIGGQARDGIGLGQCLLAGLRLAESAGRLTV